MENICRRPTPRSSANKATPTTADGNNTRTKKIFTAASARLFAHRIVFEFSNARRGASNSHSAMITNVLAKTPSRIAGPLPMRKLSNGMVPPNITALQASGVIACSLQVERGKSRPQDAKGNRAAREGGKTERHIVEADMNDCVRIPDQCEKPGQGNLDGVEPARCQHEQANHIEEDRELQQIHIRPGRTLDPLGGRLSRVGLEIAYRRRSANDGDIAVDDHHYPCDAGEDDERDDGLNQRRGARTRRGGDRGCSDHGDERGEKSRQDRSDHEVGCSGGAQLALLLSSAIVVRVNAPAAAGSNFPSLSWKPDNMLRYSPTQGQPPR